MLALQIDQLRKTYAGGTEALKGVDLKVAPGEFFALLGPNGAGKSTLIGILTGLVNKTAGRVQVFGVDLDTNPQGVKAQLGVMTQEFNFNIFESTWNTVVFQAGYHGIPKAEAEARSERLLRDLELWDKRNQPIRNLSGGMKRRVMLARALVHNPKLLILDEPTAGLDIEPRRSLWQYMQQRNAEGLTIILTTHYLEEAETLCKRVAIIDRGDILRDMPTRELLAELTRQTFVLDLVREAELPADSDGFRFERRDPMTWEVSLEKGQTVNQLFAKLGDIPVQSLRPKSNRLEELFLALTGKGAKLS